MKKLPGVEDVHVSLEKASTDVRLRPGNTVTLAQLRQVIKNGGFKAADARVTAVGRLVADTKRVALDFAPAKEILVLEADPADPTAFAEARKLAQGPAVMVEIDGIIVQGETIRLKSITPKQQER